MCERFWTLLDDSSVPLQVIATTESTDAGQAKGIDKSKRRCRIL
jgi:hypothetical protein